MMVSEVRVYDFVDDERLNVEPESRWVFGEVRLLDQAAIAAPRIGIGQLAIDRVRRFPVVGDEPGYAFAKRSLDLLIGSILLVLSLPILLIAMIAIKIDSSGPVFFAQTRVGRGGEEFTCWKLRSMVIGAEERKLQLVDRNEADGPVFKMKHDPRVTGLGRWMRKFSIDEIPQLWNVIRGNMSLVGPRPPVPSEVARYTQRQLLRLAVKPGLTCIWQVSGRSTLGFDQWVDMDIEYIEARSLATDAKLLVKTVPAVVTGRGAC